MNKPFFKSFFFEAFQAIVAIAVIMGTYYYIVMHYNCHGNPDYPLHSIWQMVCDGADK